MHPLKHPRNAIGVGLVFVVVALIYWAVPHFGGWQLDMAGFVMLAALGIAISLMAYVLIAGSPSSD